MYMLGFIFRLMDITIMTSFAIYRLSSFSLPQGMMLQEKSERSPSLRLILTQKIQ